MLLVREASFSSVIPGAAGLEDDQAAGRQWKHAKGRSPVKDILSDMFYCAAPAASPECLPGSTKVGADQAKGPRAFTS